MEAATDSSARTNIMYRSKVQKGKSVMSCTICAYSSDRRANVIRHYERIHGVLKKNIKCHVCNDTFVTKWDYYKHGAINHPTWSESQCRITNIYKVNQASRSSLQVKKKNVATKSPYRVRTETVCDSRSTEFNNRNDVLYTDEKENNCTEHNIASLNSYTTDASTLTNTSSPVPLNERNNSFTSSANISQSTANLPIKKRHMFIRQNIRVVSDKNVNVELVNSYYYNKSCMQESTQDVLLSKMS